MENKTALSLMLPVNQIERIGSYKSSHGMSKRAVIREAISQALQDIVFFDIEDTTSGPYINVSPVYVTNDQADELKSVSEETGHPLTVIVRWAIESYLEG